MTRPRLRVTSPAATAEHVSWGFFDFWRKGDPLSDGLQSLPVDRTISAERKRAFFALLREMTATATR